MYKYHYEKFFTVEQANNMKASEHRNIREAEESAQKATALTILSAFFTIVNLIALAIWMSKIAIFLFSVNILITCIIGFFGYNLYRDYIKIIKDVKKRINR